MVGTGRFAEFIPWTAPPAVSFPTPSSTTAALSRWGPFSMGRLRTHFGSKKRIRPNHPTKQKIYNHKLTFRKIIESPRRRDFCPTNTMRMAAIYVGLAVLALLTTICVPVSGSNTGGYESSTRARARARAWLRVWVCLWVLIIARASVRKDVHRISPPPPRPPPRLSRHPAVELPSTLLPSGCVRDVSPVSAVSAP